MAVPADKLQKIYDVLCEELPVGAEDLAEAVGLPVAGIPAAVAALREGGAPIAGDEVEGYRRVLPPPLDAGVITRGLTTLIGADLRSFGDLGSTQDTARELAVMGTPHGTAVLADGQYRGRGRQGRRWVSPPRLGVYLSVILERGLLPRDVGLLSIAAGVAAARAVDETSGLRVGLKWPNDLSWEGRKLGGILGEVLAWPDVVILGFGLNCFHCPYDFPAAFRDAASSLALAGAWVIERNLIVTQILNQLGGWLERWSQEGPDAVIAAWKNRAVTLGRRVKVPRRGVAGTAVDLNPDGSLAVADGAGNRYAVNAGEVVEW